MQFNGSAQRKTKQKTKQQKQNDIPDFTRTS